MATFRCTSVERAAWALATLVLSGVAPLGAGTIVTLANGNQIGGKLSVAGTAIHAETESSPPDTALTDVLEAKFGDVPFALNFFDAGKASQLPPNWTAQDIGEMARPGAVSVQDGAFTVTSGILQPVKKPDIKSDRVFFVGTPWRGDGQFTARLASLTPPQAYNQWGGVMFRDSLDPMSPMTGAAVNGQGQIRLPFRREAARENWGNTSAGNIPVWLRFVRYGNTVFTAISSDGAEWDILAQSPFKTLTNPVVGLSASGGAEKKPVIAVFDNVSITPLPSSAQVLPPGVVLQGGSLLAGEISNINFDPSSSDQSGDLTRGDKHISIPRSAVAAVITLPLERSKLEEFSPKTGVLMKNGDFTDGDVLQVAWGQVAVSSVLLGNTSYSHTDVRACFLRPIQPQRAALEVRLRDGSILNATAVTGDGNEVVITDVSGLSIQAAPDEIAQIRAGSSAVQELAPLDWKATASGVPPAPAPAPANGAPAAHPAPTLVQSWLGPDQEQVLEAGIGTSIEFPLPGKFRAFGTGITLSPDSPPNASVTLRLLADGREIAKTPALRAGQQTYVQLNVMSPAHLTVEAESIFPGTKVLYLDPIAIRN